MEFDNVSTLNDHALIFLHIQFIPDYLPKLYEYVHIDIHNSYIV